MDIRKFLCDIFDRDVISLSDYETRIVKLNNFFKSHCNRSFQAFYRGDRFCTPTQSKLFRNDLLSSEHTEFENFSLDTHDGFQSDFEKLAYMQHYQGQTRLLDFSKDPLVALRFACGTRKDNCRKKVTFYYTNYIDDPNSSEEIQILMQLVKSPVAFSIVKIKDQLRNQGYNIEAEKIVKTFSEDYFVEGNFDDLRMERQKSIFLFMGNIENYRFNSELPGRNQRCRYKVIHELSPTVGRGRMYPGYVGVFNIAAEAVPGIREELENTEEYNMNWLMPPKGE